MYVLHREAALWYHDSLFLEENKRYLEYLQKREISTDIIQKFQIGCSTDPRALFHHLKEKWFEPKHLFESGLFLTESKDKFFARVIFPISNHMGHVVAFTGRVLDDALPKYLNSPASAIFDKSSILYGMHLAKQEIAKSWEVFVVEGQMDTIALHQAGVTNAVWISGTALTTEHIHLLKRFAKILYLSFDSDDAGVKATFSSIENLANQDVEVRVISLPNGKDPDEFLKSWGDYLSLRGWALSAVGFYLREGNRQYDTATVIGRKQLLEKCITFLMPLRSQIEVDMHIREMSRLLDVSHDAIYSEYRKMLSLSQRREKSPSLFSDKSTSDMEKEVFSPFDLLAWYISSYNLFDLFFGEFHYTIEDFPRDGNFSLLSRVLSRNTLDPEDDERLKVICLALEEQHPDEDESVMRSAVIQLVKKLHESLLYAEYKKILASWASVSQALPQFIEKAKTLGVSQSVLR